MGFFSKLLSIGSKVAGIAMAPATGGASLWPSIISGGASLLGGYMANQASAKQAARMMQFQSNMSNTSYQRSMADMRAAGLNPALAYSQGGASTPGGAQAAQHDVITPAVATAMQAKRLDAEIDNIKANTYKTNVEAQVSQVMRTLYGSQVPQALKDASASSGWAGTFDAYSKKLSGIVSHAIAGVAGSSASGIARSLSKRSIGFNLK